MALSKPFLIICVDMQAVKDKIVELHLASVKFDDFHKDGIREFYSIISNLVSYQEGEISMQYETLNYYSHELAEKYGAPIELLMVTHSCHISNTVCGRFSCCKKQLRVKHELNID